MGRTFAIGDIHGHLDHLNQLLHGIDLQEDDTLIFLGDYINRGPESFQVVEKLIELSLLPLTVKFISGNHEFMLKEHMLCPLSTSIVNGVGLNTTIKSYKGNLNAMPVSHFAFYNSLLRYYENDTHIFVHASYNPENLMLNQPNDDLFWKNFRAVGKHISGKPVICGHSSLSIPSNLDGYYICIDTGVYKRNGLLNALNVDTYDCFQYNEAGLVNTLNLNL